MAGNAYIAWDELEELDGNVESLAVSAAAGQRNERLSMLLTERARLERELNRVLGKEPLSEEEQRENARFPMPIHTAESRMEDRRIAGVELRARIALKRSLERGQLRLREEQQRAERKHEQERSAIQHELLRVAEERRRGELLQLLEQRQRSSDTIQQRWVDQRRTALRAHEAARRAEWTDFDEKSTRCRELARAVAGARRQELAAVHARLDRRAEHARVQRGSGARD